MDATEVIRRCRTLAELTEEPGHITRTFLSPPMHEAQRLVRGWMESAGLAVRIDAVGNVRGIRGSGPRLMMGSHIDSVPRAGAFDGILGVMIAIALAEIGSRCALEVVAFSDEEGVRFGIPFIGSRALVGDPVREPAVMDAMREFGLDPDRMPDAVLDPAVRAYLEFHIEQGPVLDRRGLPLGVVESIAGQARVHVRFRGSANHAGTTPMEMRRDALAGAAEWIGAVEREASGGVVATVGSLRVSPGAANVIAEEARATLDVRQPDGDRSALERMLSAAAAIAERRGLRCDHETRSDQPAVKLRPEPVARAVEAAGHPFFPMVSGAGHDAMILARRVPASMLFLRSPGGVSHHPDETVQAQDVEAALEVGMRFLEQWRPE